MATSLGASVKADHRRTLPASGRYPRIVVVGLGSDDPTPEDLRRAAGAGVRHAAGLADGRPLSVAVVTGHRRARGGAGGGRGGAARQLSLRPDQFGPGPGPEDRLAHRRASTAGQFRRDRGGGRARGPSRRRRPRLGQHPRQPAVPRVLRRPGPPAGRGHPDRGRRARRQGAEPRWLRRPAGGRRRVVAAAAAGPARVPPPGRQEAPGAGRQGHHLRHRWAEPQAGRGHVHDEVRHGRGGGGVRGDRTRSPGSG